jgi:hypothetical protein
VGAFLKQAATLIAGKMAGSNNKATFIVKTLRTGYMGSGALIAVVWYSAYRNERVAPGDASFPFPGFKNLKRQYPPDREEKELNHPAKPSEAGGWGTSTSGPKILTPIRTPSMNGIPQTPADAKRLQGLGQFEGKPVAMWILPFLLYAKSHGWRGSVNNGFRTFAEQSAIWNSGVRPAAQPGTSNHEKKNFPGGAIDVTEAAQLNEILSKIPGGSLLKWAGSKDPVHFSFPHNGSY